MAGRLSVEIRGVDSLRDRLRMLKPHVREGTEAAAREAGRMGEAMMKGLAPVDTGRLRDSIRHEVQGATVRLGPGDEIEYAIFQEFGTSRMAAQPYVRPTVEALRLVWPGLVAEHVNRAIRRRKRGRGGWRR